MGFFEKLRSRPAAKAQIRSGQQHPFGMLDNYVPLGGGDVRLYRAIREAVPVLDAAVMKIIRLAGGFSVVCGDKRAEGELAEFLRTVDTGRAQRGIDAFLDNYLDSMLTSGRAVGEIVVDGHREIKALLCADVCDVQVREGVSPLDFVICARGQTGLFEPLPYQELILFTPFNPETASPYGVSMFRSMPFLAEILLKIFQSIGVNWERAGNVRFAVTYKPQGDIIDKAYARERSEQIAREWSAAMQSGKNGSVRDFVAVGDVDIKVIGADNQILDSEVPVRQILEQLVSRTGIPPFMLGLNWSSTERMSAQQADLMTSELTAIRRSLNPVIEKICDLWLRMHGYACDFEVDWEPINLQDYVEEARAALLSAQAQALELKLSEGGSL
ncbi:MAG: phage portal protein [Clostridiales bacterium]|nr:phage portal protein [Clostridiales bacterium]